MDGRRAGIDGRHIIKEGEFSVDRERTHRRQRNRDADQKAAIDKEILADEGSEEATDE